MTLAELKRKMQVGSRLQITFHSYAHQVPAHRKDSFFNVREVAVVRSNAIWFKTYDSVNKRDDISWLTWPKANQIRFTDVGFEVCLDEDGTFTHSMKYEYRDGQ